MKTIYIILYSFILISISHAQGPGQPYFPETANGASNVSYQYHILRWENPTGTIYNDIFISYDSSKVANMDASALFISGYPATAFDSIVINQQLYKPTRYFWRVVEYNSNGSTPGQIWNFVTTVDIIDFNQLDDFSFGLGKWNINNGSGCGWQLGNESDYSLPAPSTGNVLTADALLCGSPINATAYFQQVSIMEFMYFASLEFNSDWKTDNPNDQAIVEMSTDMGNSWSQIWSRTGISDRNKHIIALLFDSNWYYDTIYTVQVRFKTIQNGTNSWWAIDNVGIIGGDGILTHVHPMSLHVNVIYENQPKAILTWHQILPVPNEIIERKTGIPTNTNSYQIIGNVQASYTTTFIDTTILDSTVYTYRIGYNEGGFGGNPWYVYSNEATAYVFPQVPVELISFNASVNGNDIHLNWSTATELNNSGFEIQKLYAPLNPLQGGEQKEWVKIGFVPGHGTTTEQQHYSFIDESVSSGKYRYRLKQVDYDGTFEYSDIVEVEVGLPNEFRLEQNYPNPFNPTTKIKYSIPSIGTSLMKFIQLKVYDVLGNEVATLVNEEKPAGTYEVEFDAADLTSAIYFYQLKAGSFIQTKKMILIK